MNSGPLSNENGVGSIDPKDTINIPENEPFPRNSASGLPTNQGETAVIHGGDGIVQQQRLAHDVDYDAQTPVALDDGTSRANHIQNAQRDGEANTRSGEFVDGGTASSTVAPVGDNERVFDGSGGTVPSAPEGKPYGVGNRQGGIDWFATEEQAQQYADSNPGFYRIAEEVVPERDRQLTDDERANASDVVVWSKSDDGQLHQFANAKARDVMLEAQPTLGYAYEPTTAEIDAYDGVLHTEESVSENPGGERETRRSLGEASHDGRFYARNNDGEERGFDSEADRDAYVDSTPGTVAYTLPAE